MALNKAQKIFVAEMSKHGDEDLATELAYPQLKGDAKKIRTYCGRLLKNVEIAQEIQQLSTKFQQLATSKAVEEIKTELVSNALTAIEKRNLLSEIARGDARIQEQFMKYNKKGEPEMETYYREPTPFERMKAIEIDGKMAGDFAPIKQDVKIEEKVSEESVKAILEKLR
jgi:hypothetical protein